MRLKRDQISYNVIPTYNIYILLTELLKLKNNSASADKYTHIQIEYINKFLFAINFPFIWNSINLLRNLEWKNKILMKYLHCIHHKPIKNKTFIYSDVFYIHF
jgi:hypothetical protein